jgi:hypothetical protein
MMLHPLPTQDICPRIFVAAEPLLRHLLLLLLLQQGTFHLIYAALEVHPLSLLLLRFRLSAIPMKIEAPSARAKIPLPALPPLLPLLALPQLPSLQETTEIGREL